MGELRSLRGKLQKDLISHVRTFRASKKRLWKKSGKDLVEL